MFFEAVSPLIEKQRSIFQIDVSSIRFGNAAVMSGGVDKELFIDFIDKSVVPCCIRRDTASDERLDQEILEFQFIERLVVSSCVEIYDSGKVDKRNVGFVRRE